MKKGLFILGGLLAVSFLLPVYGLASTVILRATDDAFVFSSNPAWNYGHVTNLLVSKAFASGQLTGERRTYIKFDLSSLAGIDPAYITSVKLRLFVTTSARGQVEVYHSGDDTWEQGLGLGQEVPGITWYTQPAIERQPIGTSPVLSSTYTYYTIDLLANGNSWLAGDLNDNYLSIALLLPAAITESTAYYFCGQEANPAVCEGPSLVIQLAPGALFDYDGDRITDVAAFHFPTFQFLRFENDNRGALGWGTVGTDFYPLIWDQNGDGNTDISVYHIPTNQWFIRGYPAANENMGMGGFEQDHSIPVPGDYDGDGQIERAFYYWPDNRWFIERKNTPGAFDIYEFGYGGGNCIPIVGDFDGDGKDDMVLYNVADNQWFMYGYGTTNELGKFGWNGADCIPVPGDWNGDGKWELGIYYANNSNPTGSNEWLWREHDRPDPADVHFLHQFGWGAWASFPIPGDYNGDGIMERAFYRPGENLWFIEGQPEFSWGWDGRISCPLPAKWQCLTGSVLGWGCFNNFEPEQVF